MPQGKASRERYRKRRKLHSKSVVVYLSNFGGGFFGQIKRVLADGHTNPMASCKLCNEMKERQVQQCYHGWTIPYCPRCFSRDKAPNELYPRPRRFMVCCNDSILKGAWGPLYYYTSLLSAKNEAERLTREHPRYTFYVCELLHTVKAEVTTNLKWS